MTVFVLSCYDDVNGDGEVLAVYNSLDAAIEGLPAHLENDEEIIDFDEYTFELYSNFEITYRIDDMEVLGKKDQRNLILLFWM